MFFLRVKSRLEVCVKENPEREKGERTVLKNEKGREENKEEKQKAQEFQMRSLR